MSPKEFSALARRLMICRAAPYFEASVRAALEEICEENRLDYRRDRFGNVIVQIGNAKSERSLVLAAHMDHPGFEIIRRLGPRRWLARFNGGVPDSYFVRGTRVLLEPGGMRAQLGRRLGAEKLFEIGTPRPVSGEFRFAVWDLVDFTVRGGRIHARACDDLGGVAGILATMIDLKRSGARAHVIGVISRAEEVGFQGALTVAASKLIPRDSVVISLETSKELPPAKMGQGVIIRVGDRSSIFDPTATRFLTEVAGEIRHRDSRFQFQRALMFGGTCEATAYQEFGFQTAAVCVALGNYHNCSPAGRIAAEFIDLEDVCSMVRLLVGAARQMKCWRRLTGKLPARLNRLLREARVRLRQPAE